MRKLLTAILFLSTGSLYAAAPPTHTHTRTFTNTKTATITPTNTFTNTATNTPTSTNTNTATNTPTITPTNTPTGTLTNTPTDTPTPTNTNTATNSPTNTPTRTPTNSPTNTPTKTPTPTFTNTGTNTHTFTPTKTWTPGGVAVYITKQGAGVNGNLPFLVIAPTGTTTPIVVSNPATPDVTKSSNAPFQLTQIAEARAIETAVFVANPPTPDATKLASASFQLTQIAQVYAVQTQIAAQPVPTTQLVAITTPGPWSGVNGAAIATHAIAMGGTDGSNFRQVAVGGVGNIKINIQGRGVSGSADNASQAYVTFPNDFFGQAAAVLPGLMGYSQIIGIDPSGNFNGAEIFNATSLTGSPTNANKSLVVTDFPMGYNYGTTTFNKRWVENVAGPVTANGAVVTSTAVTLLYPACNACAQVIADAGATWSWNVETSMEGATYDTNAATIPINIANGDGSGAVKCFSAKAYKYLRLRAVTNGAGVTTRAYLSVAPQN